MELLAMVLQKDYDNGYKYVTQYDDETSRVVYLRNELKDTIKIVELDKVTGLIKIQEYDYRLFIRKVFKH